ncbi:hypothetical protein ACFLRM_00700 [Acidobacteriota bacterium]
MKERNKHIGKSRLEKQKYYKRLSTIEDENPTMPSQGQDIDPASTESPKTEDELKKDDKKRPSDKRKENIETIKYYGLLFYKFLLFIIFPILIGLYINLSIQVGKVEERMKDISRLENKITTLDANVMSMNTKLEILINDIKRNNELYNYKLEEMAKRIEK